MFQGKRSRIPQGANQHQGTRVLPTAQHPPNTRMQSKVERLGCRKETQRPRLNLGANVREQVQIRAKTAPRDSSQSVLPEPELLFLFFSISPSQTCRQTFRISAQNPPYTPPPFLHAFAVHSGFVGKLKTCHVRTLEFLDHLGADIAARLGCRRAEQCCSTWRQRVPSKS